MPFHVQCRGCQTSAYIDCGCPPELQALGSHVVTCAMVSPDAQVACPADGPCCQEDHDHAAAANACPGGHGDCPEPKSCRLHKSLKAHHVALAAGGHLEVLDPGYKPPPEECPGGHCHQDLDDCTVCRPLVITAMPGSATLHPAGVI